jgi:hypothetical protein
MKELQIRIGDENMRSKLVLFSILAVASVLLAQDQRQAPREGLNEL